MLTRATTLNRGDVVKSAVPLSKPVRVTVTLKLRDEAGMKAFLGQPSHGVMSQAQLANHLPTQAQAQAVANYLKGAGFTNIQISANRMLVNATGSAAAVQSAFKTPLVNVHTKDGRNAFANSAAIQIPASLQGTVQAVLGLQTVHKAHTLVQTNARVGVGGHMPTEFADIYGASSLPAATDVDAAVWGWGSMENTVNDLTDFMESTGLSAGTVNVVCTDTNGIDWSTFTPLGGISIGDPTCNGNFDEGETEWSMDSQSILAMSGGVKSLTFYAAYGGYNITVTDSLNEIVTPTVGEPLAQVINASFGECERYQDANQGGDGSMQSNDAMFQLAVAQGQTFSVSTGDAGSDECGDGQANSASYPASSPWVVAVSGTTLRASDTTWARENVWLDAGGSPSSAEAAQPWQAGLTYGTFAGQRGPDVAFDANPSSGELVLLQGNYYQIGGTSLAAPLFAGSWARILESNPALGFAAPSLYTLPAAALHDVRAGNNGQYLAKPGWDWATGLGSFDVGRAAAILAPAQPEVRRTTKR
ncbi:MAG TPA: S53 family peptidase [Rhodanobacteraceae bacterium]|nr:S53 family peptidase [Rhodanobacteraceae bacterium]